MLGLKVGSLVWLILEALNNNINWGIPPVADMPYDDHAPMALQLEYYPAQYIWLH